MTLVIKELRDALIEAGASPEKAEAAAKAVLPSRSAATKAEVRLEVADLKICLDESLSRMTWRIAILLVVQGVGIVGLTVTLVNLLP